MNPFVGRGNILAGLTLRRPRRVGAFGFVVVAMSVLPLFLAWPYISLWRIDQAVRSGDMVALGNLVDLESVRAEIKKKLNKDVDSSIGELSDSFIRRLEEAIGVTGNQAVERLVTLSWVQGRLLAHSADDPAQGYLGQITYAFFDTPDDFVVRIGAATGTPVHLHLTQSGLYWRVYAVYY